MCKEVSCCLFHYCDNGWPENQAFKNWEHSLIKLSTQFQFLYSSFGFQKIKLNVISLVRKQGDWNCETRNLASSSSLSSDLYIFLTREATPRGVREGEIWWSNNCTVQTEVWQSLDPGPQEAAALTLLIRLRHSTWVFRDITLLPGQETDMHSELYLEHKRHTHRRERQHRSFLHPSVY